MRYLLITILCSTPALAQPIRVTATGDSLTNGYALTDGSRLLAGFVAAGVDAEVSVVATGGLKSPQYVGRTINIHDGYLRDYVADVIATDPDVILFMLGTNDAYNCTPGEFEEYKQDLTYIWDSYETFVNGRGEHPMLVVSTVIPNLREDEASYDAQKTIDERINPWLRTATVGRSIRLLDNNLLIQREEDWQSLYSTDLVHLNWYGYQWMVSSFVSSTQEYPKRIPDFDGDGDVDQTDFGIFQVCRTGPDGASPEGICLLAELDGDEDVDSDDGLLMQVCASGPGILADPECR